jgi:hypothetical protein
MTEPGEFSTTWSNIPNMQGIKPPYPQFVQYNPTTPMYANILVPNTTATGKSPVGVIQSKREPYGVEWYWGDYGSMNSRLGTNIGTNRNK